LPDPDILAYNADTMVSAYRTILVSLNEIDRLETVLDGAGAIAAAGKAHLIGLYVIPAPTVYPAVGPYVVPEVFDGLTRYFEEQSKNTRAKFTLALGRHGLQGDWLEVRAQGPTLSETVSEIGRSADLIVLSETNRDGKTGGELDFAENVILGAARPVLILPRAWSPPLRGELIACGYNGSKEASRALHEAVPLLMGAREVRLIWVDPPEGEPGEPMPRGSLMAASLNRQGVKAKLETLPSNGRNAADVVIARAGELQAGIIVMGAYGHSRIREFVLGGATRHALNHIPIPMLMSH
jgi:nucleotide-binding universal stress UspA family protein